MAEVIDSHHVLRSPHAVIGFAAYDSRRHDVAGSQILQFAPVGSCKGAHEVPFRNDADHAIAWFADGHRANAVRVHEVRNGCQTIIRQARYKPLTGVLEKLANLHGVPPESRFPFSSRVRPTSHACDLRPGKGQTTILR